MVRDIRDYGNFKEYWRLLPALGVMETSDSDCVSDSGRYSGKLQSGTEISKFVQKSVLCFKVSRRQVAKVAYCC